MALYKPGKRINLNKQKRNDELVQRSAGVVTTLLAIYGYFELVANFI